MSVLKPSAPAPRGRRRRAPRPMTAALVGLLRAHRPPTTAGEADVWICLTAATATAIAQIAARREDATESDRDHPAHKAAQQPMRVSATTAAIWRQDACHAAAEGLIAATDALAVCAQIDPPEAP
jgi:hypothetical protein